MSYNNELRGVLFRVENKKGPKHPDMTGRIEIEGVEYSLAAWKTASKDGSKTFLSLKASLPQPRQAASPARRQASVERQAPPQQEELNDEIPW
jgi:hypothetical protein